MNGVCGGEVDAKIETETYQQNLEFILSTNGCSQPWKSFQRQLDVLLMLHSDISLMNLEKNILDHSNSDTCDQNFLNRLLTIG